MHDWPYALRSTHVAPFQYFASGQSQVSGPKVVGQFVPMPVKNEHMSPLVESHGVVQSHEEP